MVCWNFAKNVKCQFLFVMACPALSGCVHPPLCTAPAKYPKTTCFPWPHFMPTASGHGRIAWTCCLKNVKYCETNSACARSKVRNPQLTMTSENQGQHKPWRPGRISIAQNFSKSFNVKSLSDTFLPPLTLPQKESHLTMLPQLLTLWPGRAKAQHETTALEPALCHQHCG